jgi:hypothetical protein
LTELSFFYWNVLHNMTMYTLSIWLKTIIYTRIRRFMRVHFYCLILELKSNLVKPWRTNSSTYDIGVGAFRTLFMGLNWSKRFSPFVMNYTDLLVYLYPISQVVWVVRDLKGLMQFYFFILKKTKWYYFNKKNYWCK